MKVAVVLFPGSNCDHDICYLFGSVLSCDVDVVWHRESSLGDPDLVMIPGGFSYGDYLRCGALAKVSPIMKAVKEFAAKGGAVLGICNGFQILCESGLLPGVLLQNVRRKFLSQFVDIKVENTSTPFTKALEVGSVINCPIAHFEGNYFADSDTIRSLEDNNQVIFRYCSGDGEVDSSSLVSNPNGSINSIAGISNEEGNVVGMMPHPERAIQDVIGGTSGLGIFQSLLAA